MPLNFPVRGSLVAGLSVRLVIVTGSVLLSMPAPTACPLVPLGVEAEPVVVPPPDTVWIATGVLNRIELASSVTETVELASIVPVPLKNVAPWLWSGPADWTASRYSADHLMFVLSGWVATFDRASIRELALGEPQPVTRS